jgi:hypothetical protein
MKHILFLVCILGFSHLSFSQVPVVQSPWEEAHEVSSWPIDPLEYHKLMNEYRVSIGLKPLEYLVPVEKVARYHSQGMASKKRPFGHIGWQYRCKWLNKSLKAKNCGEIVAFGQKTPEAVLKAWIESQDHRESLEKPDWTHTGLGIARNSYGRIYWTQMFVKLDLPDAPVSPQENKNH